MLVGVTGPGWYFAEGRAQADDLRVSPDGRWVLAQIAQQLHLLQMPEPGKTIDVAQADSGHRKLTGTGADFFGWADRGRTITWALGSHFYRVPLDAPRDGKRSEGHTAELPSRLQLVCRLLLEKKKQ